MGISMRVNSTSKDSLCCRARIVIAGTTCEVNTNSQAFADLLRSSLDPARGTCRSTFTMHVVVNEESGEQAEPPHFRGLHHVVVASFGSANLFIYDLLRRHVSATVSAALTRDARFWVQKILPMTIGVLGAAVGTMPMHCACLASQGDGLLIAGNSGAGKSTLSVALSQTDFEYVSDDWTYFSYDEGRLVAHGTSAPVKLLPNAVQHFTALSDHAVGMSMNGELAYEVDASEVFGARVVAGCEPKWLIFLERMAEPGIELTPLHSAETRDYLESSVERLPLQLAEAEANRARIIARIAQLPRWRFRYGGTPQFAAERLREFVARQRQEACE